MKRRRIAFYGGSFDPVHLGHLAISDQLVEMFGLDEFVFIPAFHAPHKPDRKPTSAIHRYAMLAIATNATPRSHISTMEIDLPAKPYTIETLARIRERLPNDEIFFVMGADSWQDIRTWREWESVLLACSHIVMTRPGFEIAADHVTDAVRDRIVDLRGRSDGVEFSPHGDKIYFTDTVNMDLSATRIRGQVADGIDDWRTSVPKEVAKYIEKYELYK